MNVEVVDYNPAWKDWFKTIKSTLTPLLWSIPHSIEHIGSTSIEGLAAKPVIDIDILLEDFGDFEKTKIKLCANNYDYKGNLGLKGREMFKHQNPEYPHNLYVCDSTSLAVKNHFAFRDYLRHHPKEVALYADLKKALAQQHPNDIDSYCEGKNDFIGNILKQCPFSEDELAEIKATNTLD